MGRRRDYGTLEIEKRVRVVRAARGRGKEVILPYAVYRDLMELKTTMEIYERTEVQQSLRKGKKEVSEGRTMSFRKAPEPSGGSRNRIRPHRRTAKTYNLLPAIIRKKFDKQLRFLLRDPRHPSLKIHRLNGEWEFYIDIHYRLSSGIYYYQIRAANYFKTKQMILVR